jgi:hypothetical protein
MRVGSDVRWLLGSHVRDPRTARSTIAISKVRSTSTPAGGFAQRAVIRGPRGEPVESTPSGSFLRLRHSPRVGHVVIGAIVPPPLLWVFIPIAAAWFPPQLEKLTRTSYWDTCLSFCSRTVMLQSFSSEEQIAIIMPSKTALLPGMLCIVILATDH